MPVDSRRLLRRLLQGQMANVAFGDMQRLLKDFGFELDRINGSHHIYRHPTVSELVNIQEVRQRG